MWYFSWTLGLGLAASFGILNAMWFEFREDRLKAANADDDGKAERLARPVISPLTPPALPV